jgi:CRP/FNR family transcriptional regulator, anaerobic regulatory protein
MPILPLLKYISRSHSIERDDVLLLTEYFKFEKFPKGYILEKENSLTQKLYFTVSGILIAVNHDAGEEVVTQIAGANNFITSFVAFIQGSVSTETIKCISNCAVLSITKENYDKLHSESTFWSSFCRGVNESMISAYQERIKEMLVLSADKRYLKLLSHRPEIVQNLPVQYIASYIGVKPESLSRIRKKIFS